MAKETHMKLFTLLSLLLAAGPASAMVTELRYRGNICDNAPDPAQCAQTLRTLAETIKTNPYEAVHSTLTTSLEKAQTFKAVMSELTNLKGLYPNDRIALKDCLDEMDDSVDDLRKSVKEAEQYMVNVNEVDYVLHRVNVQAWVSAVMTNHQACEEAFKVPSLNEKIKVQIDKYLPDSKTSAEIALVIVENLASSFRHRR